MSTEQHLRIINVVPMLKDHKTEIAADILKLQQECGVTDVAFILPFMPEEKMASLAKAKRLREIFLTMREVLDGSRLNIGILVQSTMGHGMASESDFTRSVSAKGIVTASICPLAPGFKEYIHDSMKIAASAKPDFMLIDDDFRLANYGALSFPIELIYCAVSAVIPIKLQLTLITKIRRSRNIRTHPRDSCKTSFLKIIYRKLPLMLLTKSMQTFILNANV